MDGTRRRAFLTWGSVGLALLAGCRSPSAPEVEQGTLSGPIGQPAPQEQRLRLPNSLPNSRFEAWDTECGPYKLRISDDRPTPLELMTGLSSRTVGGVTTIRYNFSQTDLQVTGDQLTLNGATYAIPPGTKQISVVNGVLTFDGKSPTGTLR